MNLAAEMCRAAREITPLEEELLPAMALFLARVECIDRAIEADQEAAAQALAAAGSLC